MKNKSYDKSSSSSDNCYNTDYMKDVKDSGMMNEVKTSTSGVPTWSEKDMNQADAKTK